MELGEIKIRQFRKEDFGQTFSIVRVCFSYPYLPSYLEKFHQQYPQGFFVVEKQGKVIAYIAGQVKNGAGHIGSLAVLPEFQRKGIGKELVRFLAGHFKKEGLEKITAHIRVKNEQGIVFYKKLGFEIAKTLKKLYPDGEDGYLMGKEISTGA